jgi:hypothetical protein
MGNAPGSGSDPAPIDRPILEHVRARLSRTRQFVSVSITDDDGHLELQARLAAAYRPTELQGASLIVRWYTNDDFAIHYRERWADDDSQCRWDRHPNPHNSRNHFHPPPNAATPEVDEEWPTDYREGI